MLQLFSAAIANASSSNIAWWAHIGGFIAGILFLRLFLIIPSTGASKWLRQATSKRKTPHLQVVRSDKREGLHLYGTVLLLPREASTGTRKPVNIPIGLQKRIYRVAVPPGVNEGTVLRLAGMGRISGDGQRGDLYLKVRLAQ